MGDAKLHNHAAREDHEVPNDVLPQLGPALLGRACPGAHDPVYDCQDDEPVGGEGGVIEGYEGMSEGMDRIEGSEGW